MEDKKNFGPRIEPPTGRELAIALGALYASTFGLLGLSLALPVVTGWLQAGLAVLLLVIPSVALRGTGLTVDDLGVQLGPWGRTARLAGVTMLIVFPLFTAGFLWFQEHVVGHPARLSLDGAARWSEALEGAPARPCPRPGAPVNVWIEGGGLWVVPPAGHTLDASLVLRGAVAPTPRAVRCTNHGPPTVSRRLPPSAAPPAAGAEAARPSPPSWRAPPASGLWFPLGAARGLRLRVWLDGRPAALATGAQGEGVAPGPLEAERSWWWVLSFLVVHLGLVALPEEWFFRGYLQARLDARLGTPWRLLGADVGWGFVLAAAAFALLHPILVPGLYRLAVFFPGLLFGWLRARGGNIGPAVLTHAASNLLQALLIHMLV